jgi:catechol 2,3-dioxygenase-like lactoylglutathione lyase family enzyme
MEQKLGSTRLPGGTTVAYATAGGGPFLLFIGGWLSHLELSWALPAERHLFEGLARGRTIIRYDRPGCGLSDRPTQASASLESELDVIAAVVDLGTGISHLVIQVGSLEVTLADLAARGIVAAPPGLPAGEAGPRTSWVTDPDGYRIELVQWSAGHADGITEADFA